MNEEITASTVFDAPTMLPAYKWHGRRHALQQWLPLLFVPLAIVIYFFGNPPNQWRSIQDLYPLVILLGGVGFFFWNRTTGQKQRLAKELKRVPDYEKPVSWIVRENGFEQRVGESHSFTEWALLYESVASPEGALLYPQKGIFYWLPKTAFASESDYAGLIQLLKAKTKFSRIN